MIIRSTVLFALTFCFLNCNVNDSQNKDSKEDEIGTNSSDLKKVFEFKQENKGFTIYQSEEGESILQEFHPIDENSVLTESMNGKSLAEIHSSLLPNKEIPEIVKHSDWTYQPSEENTNADIASETKAIIENGEIQNNLPLRKSSAIWDTWFVENICYYGNMSFCLPNQNFFWTERGWTNVKHGVMKLMVYTGSEAQIDIFIGGKLKLTTVQFASNLVYKYTSTSASYYTFFGYKDFKLQTHTYKVTSKDTGKGWSQWHWTGGFSTNTFTSL